MLLRSRGRGKLGFFFGKMKDSFKVLVADYLPRNVTALFKNTGSRHYCVIPVVRTGSRSVLVLILDQQKGEGYSMRR